jgi:ATP-dependent RNA helicase DeaD
LAEPSSCPPRPPEAGTSSASANEPIIATEGETPSFESLGLSERILDNLRAVGFARPTPIQAQFIPPALAGRDVMGQARTGTGKTAAFLLPIFQRLRPGAARPQVLILAPTRELALQTKGEIARLGQGLGFASVILYGGASYEPQIAALEKGVDLVVATPGRLMDHLRARRLDLSAIRVAVLDEADRMLDLGFRRDIEYILRHCPRERQTLLLSATIPDDILILARRFMREPEELWLSTDKPAVEQVEQYYCLTEADTKLPLLLKVLDEERPSLAIIFCATKRGARKLALQLQRLHLIAREIHGDLVQSKREKIMAGFRHGKVHLLVATDVAARGLDVEGISHIINYDVPYRAEDYIHRIGRTARMDREGKAFTLVGKDEGPLLTEIELYVNKELKRVEYPTLESRFWPHPPPAPPPEFADDAETAVGAEDYLEAAPKREGGGRDRGRARAGRKGDARHGPPKAHARRERAAPPSGAGATPVAEDGEPARPPLTGGASPAVGDGPRHSRRGGRGRGGPIEITCAACGAKSQVHFRPDPSRPVYCDPCYATLKASRDVSRKPSGEERARNPGAPHAPRAK